MPDPFRTPVRRCELCDREVPLEEIEPRTGAEVCARCRGGELDQALARWRLACSTRELEHPVHLLVELTHPTPADLHVVLEPERARGWLQRVLVSGDPEVGDPAFDRAVHITPGDVSFTEPSLRVLRDGAVRRAVLELTRRGCTVVLSPSGVAASTRQRGSLAELKLLAVVLGIAIERSLRTHEEPQARGSCVLCGAEESNHALAPLAGLLACQRCRVWEEGRLTRHTGLSCRSRHSAFEGRSEVTVSELAFDDYVVFEHDSWLRRTLGSRDAEVGDPDFDRKVEVRPSAGDLLGLPLARALERPELRQAILELLELAGRGGSVAIEGRTLTIRLRPPEGDLHDANLACLKPLAVALVVALNRTR